MGRHFWVFCAFFECRIVAMCERRHLGCCINFSYFLWQKFVEGMCWSIFLARRILCMIRLFLFFFIDCFGRVLVSSYRPAAFYLWFLAELVFPNYLIVFQFIHFRLRNLAIMSTERQLTDEIVLTTGARWVFSCTYIPIYQVYRYMKSSSGPCGFDNAIG